MSNNLKEQEKLFDEEFMYDSALPTRTRDTSRIQPNEQIKQFWSDYVKECRKEIIKDIEQIKGTGSTNRLKIQIIEKINNILS
jgi:hypothetical protein